MIKKVCIPAAGLGTRLGNLSKGLNKSLVAINNKPAICYIIEKYQVETQYIILLGFGGSELKQFLKLAYPERKFKFISVDIFEGEGSGLGYSLLKAKDYLQEPFIFNSCDTIIRGDLPNFKNNWIGFDIRDNSKEYRTITEENGFIKNILDKNDINASKKAYIGLAGIKDYKLFWNNLNLNNKSFISQGEALGLNNLIDIGIKAVNFSWFDTGNPIELARTKSEFNSENSPNILEKEGESIWFVNNKVIKYSKDNKFIQNRVKRAALLRNFVPRIIGKTDNMYSYNLVKGNVLSEIINPSIFQELLSFLDTFWVSKNLNSTQKKCFLTSCKSFYKSKTKDRVKQFLSKYPYMKEIKEINSIKVESLDKLLHKLDWESLFKGKVGRFHGDFHFENIIYNSNEEKFIFLDWRQDFGGEIEYGDIYYDLAKLKHGILVQHEFMTKNKFKIDFNNKKISFNFIRNFNHIECEKVFNNWLQGSNFSLKKVNIMTALVFLNIAPMHHFKYDQFLFSLGYYLLNDELN